MPRIVVLLHGLGRTRFSMSYLGRFLSHRGFTVHNFGYPSRRSSITEHVETIHRALGRAGCRDQQLNFVTHSLGGIVMRGLVSKHLADYRFGRAVMLGPPNQGAQFARLLHDRLPALTPILGPSYREVGSIQQPVATEHISVGIIAGSRTPERGYSPFVSGANDGIVAVAETELPGAADTVVVRGVHSFLMFQPTVLQQVAYFLDHGEFKRDG